MPRGIPASGKRNMKKAGAKRGPKRKYATQKKAVPVKKRAVKKVAKPVKRTSAKSAFQSLSEQIIELDLKVRALIEIKRSDFIDAWKGTHINSEVTVDEFIARFENTVRALGLTKEDLEIEVSNGPDDISQDEDEPADEEEEEEEVSEPLSLLD